MAKKVNWFDANKALAGQVTDFMFKTLWYAEVKMEREALLAQTDERINGLRNLRGSVLWTDQNAAQLLSLYDERAAQEKALDEWIENAEVRFSVKDFALGDTYPLVRFRKEYKECYDATCGVSMIPAIRHFFSAYGVDIANTQDEVILHDAIRGDGKASLKKTVRSNGTVWTDHRSPNEVTQVFVRKLAEILIVKGTVKPAKIAPELAEKYAPKKRNKKA